MNSMKQGDYKVTYLDEKLEWNIVIIKLINNQTFVLTRPKTDAIKNQIIHIGKRLEVITMSIEKNCNYLNSYRRLLTHIFI